VGLSIGVVSALIQAGALDGFSASRSRVVLEAQLWNLLTEKEKVLCNQFGPDHQYDLVKLLKFLSQAKNENGKLLIKESRFQTIKKKYEPYLQIYLQNNKSESFANWYYENKLLGYTYNKSLKDIFSPKINKLSTTAEINNLPNNANIFLVAKVLEASQWVSKNEKKTRTFKMLVSDEFGSVSVLMFNDKIDNNKSANNDTLPDKEDIVIIKGNKKEDCIFADTIGIQTLKIYTKLSELKEKILDNSEEKTNDIT